MDVINAKHNANEQYFKAFLIRCDDNILILCNGQTLTTERLSFFEKLFTLNVTENDEIECRSANVSLLLLGIDVLWWKETTRRKNKLLKIYDELSLHKAAKQYCVATAILTTDGIAQVKTMTGVKADVIAFFNTDIKERYIDNFLQNKIVFNLCYAIGDEKDNSAWFTLDELQDAGLIILR